MAAATSCTRTRQISLCFPPKRAPSRVYKNPIAPIAVAATLTPQASRHPAASFRPFPLPPQSPPSIMSVRPHPPCGPFPGETKEDRAERKFWERVWCYSEWVEEDAPPPWSTSTASQGLPAQKWKPRPSRPSKIWLYPTSRMHRRSSTVWLRKSRQPKPPLPARSLPRGG